jgi:hypothetical protein
MAQVAKCRLCKHEALSSNPSLTRNKKKEEEEEEEILFTNSISFCPRVLNCLLALRIWGLPSQSHNCTNQFLEMYTYNIYKRKKTVVMN